MMNRRTFVTGAAAAAGYTLLNGNLQRAFGLRDSRMPFQIGICTSIKNGRMVMDMGYDYIEESVGGFLAPADSLQKFEANLQQSLSEKIPVRSLNSFLPGSFRITGPTADHDPILKYAEEAFARAQKAGVRFIVFGSGGARKIPEGFPYYTATEQFVALLTKMGPIARKYDVVIALEPLSVKEVNFFHTVAEGLDICKKVEHPNIRLLADFYHMAANNEKPEVLTTTKGYLVHCHMAEGESRRVAGTSNFDFRPYFKALTQIGYRGGVSFECRWENFEAEAQSGLLAIRESIGMSEY